MGTLFMTSPFSIMKHSKLPQHSTYDSSLLTYFCWIKEKKERESRGQTGPLTYHLEFLNSRMGQGVRISKKEQNSVIFGLRNFHKVNNFQLSKRQALKQDPQLHIRLLKMFTSQVIKLGLCPLETREMNQCLLVTTKGFAVFMPH